MSVYTRPSHNRDRRHAQVAAARAALAELGVTCQEVREWAAANGWMPADLPRTVNPLVVDSYRTAMRRS